MKDILAYLVIAVVAYLMGSISTGLLVSRLLHGPNLREVGSKNTGSSLCKYVRFYSAVICNCNASVFA